MSKPESASKNDGQLHAVEPDDIAAGTVLRMVSPDGTSAPFSDLVVLDAYWVDAEGRRTHLSEEDTAQAVKAGILRGREVLVARPYLYATSTGTACPTALTGVETLKVDARTLLRGDSLFRTVCTARGNVHTFVK